ncbi:MAG: Uncharacterised protein [Formosa sp. Hel1_33_131]|nr:MAG: Uncharacterised protein [Formosa sp. Hel1_33_131]
MKKIYVLLLSLTITSLSFGQTTGDIAFIGFNADGSDDIAIVVLADIAANTTIYITDNEVNGLALADTNEGELTWVTGADIITSGTVVTFTDLSTGTSSVVSHGSISEGNSFNLSGGGDAVFMFLGTDASTPTVFLAGVQNASGVAGTLEGSGLTDGSTFFTFTNSGSPDGGYYSGDRDTQAAFTDYINLISIPANWTTETSNGELVLPFVNTPFTLGTPSPTIVITSPADSTVYIPETSTVEVTWSSLNASASDTVTVTVIEGMSYTDTPNATSPFSITVQEGGAYTVTTELKNSLGDVLDTDTTSFSVGVLQVVANITALRADVVANGPDGFYEITEGSLLTHKDGYNGKKWFQDATPSGIYIYDAEDVIATTYNVGDMVSGLKGKAVIVNGVLQLHPIEDSGVIASSDNAVVAQTVTISGFIATPSDYESTFINFENVTFSAGDGAAVFATGQNYVLAQGQVETVVRTEFYGADYIGEIIPSTELANVSGIAGAYNGTAQLYVRNLADLTTTLAAGQFEVSKFNLYPNPTKSDFVNITSTGSGAMQAAIFDILGKQVINTTVSNKRINISTLNTGIYIVKLTQGAATTTKKLIIQ